MHVLKESTFYHFAITMMVVQTTYNVNENARPAQLVLVFSNLSATEYMYRIE